MKKLVINLFLMFLSVIAFSQSYIIKLKELNSFLTTFDNGYYGYLSIEDGFLIDHYKSGTFSKIPLSSISEAKVEEVNRKVAIYCVGNAYCVIGNTGSTFDNMPFSTTSDFNASGFAADLNAFVIAYKNKNSPVNSASVKSTATFPLRTKVKVIKEDTPFNLLEALSEENQTQETPVGIVIGSDLESLGGGWYSGRLRLNDGTVKFYKKAQFQIVN